MKQTWLSREALRSDNKKEKIYTVYTSLFHQRNGSSKNTYNIINKENTISKQRKHDNYQFSEKMTIKLQSILK